MKRTLVFLLLGSMLVYCVAWTICMPPGIDLADPIVRFYAVMLLVLSLFLSAIARLLDGQLAQNFPIGLRASVFAFAGAAIAALLGMTFPQWVLIPLAIGAALSMAVCSLLSNDYRG
jgi:hypothetical protein